MSKPPSYLLLSRHSVWYFRIVVPDAIRMLFDKRELRRSLQTKCKREALIRSRELLGQVQVLFTEAFQGKRPSLDRFGISEGGYNSDSSWAQWVVWNAGLGSVRSSSGEVGLPADELGPSLSQVMEEYEKRQRLDSVSEKTIRDKRAVVDLLIRIVGDLPIKHVVRKDAQSFRETALKLPPRLNQLPKKSLRQIIREAEITISTVTFNNYLKNLTTLFTFAIQEGYCDKNPFDGLRVKQREKVSQQRSRFTLEEIQRLVPHEPYLHTPSVKPYKYWLPLLGLYTGARLNELCQLYVDDVVQVDGIDCIHIRSLRPDQKLKNLTSERLIPIHSKLKALGFIHYVNEQKTNEQKRVFSELVCHKNHGYAAGPSKWFASVREQLGFKGGPEKKDFHSFRHTVADCLKQQGVAESLVGGVLGHLSGGITFNRYGKDFNPAVLELVIEQLDFL